MAKKAASIESEYMTVPEVARLLRISRTNAYKHINSGALKSFSFGANGGATRVLRTDFETFRASRVNPREVASASASKPKKPRTPSTKATRRSKSRA